jgi:sugar (pentulose or hexulose) kinase
MKDSAANLTGHYPIDFKKKKWYPKPDKHLKGQIFSIKESMLCEIVPEGDKIGNILPKAAKETGLPEGLPVFAAGSDKSCETLGTGVVDSDYLAVSLGTACTVETTVTKYIEPIKFLPCYPACVDGYYNMDVQIYRGFWMINWFLKEFGATVIDDVTLSEYVADDFNKEMMTIPAGSGGLVLQPFWGPLLDRPAVKGAVVGFNDSTRRIHFYKAIIEGIGYALREAAEGFEKKLHKGFRGVRISGGGSLSPEICQVMADIFGLPVTRVQTNEASSLGAAMAAFIALGTYHDPKDAAKNMVTIRDTFQPNFVNHQVYNKLYKDVYLKLYPSLKSSYQYLWNFAK